MIDKYEIGKKCSLNQLKDNPRREAIITSAMNAFADPEPDEFTAGWIDACEEKMQELYGESIKEFLNDRSR